MSDDGYGFGRLCSFNGNSLQYFTKFNSSRASAGLKSDCQPALISSVKIKQFEALFIGISKGHPKRFAGLNTR